MPVHAAPIAAEAFGDVLGGIVERRMRVGRLALAAESEAAARMDVDVAGEERTGAAERDVGFERVVEILVRDHVELRFDARSKCVGEIEMSAGNGDEHRFPPVLE